MIRNLLDHPLNLLIVVVVIAVLVGWKRLPDVTRSVGRSMRIFKSEVAEMKNDGKEHRPSAASTDTVDGDVVPPLHEPRTGPVQEPRSPVQEPHTAPTTQPVQEHHDSHLRPPA